MVFFFCKFEEFDFIIKFISLLFVFFEIMDKFVDLLIRKEFDIDFIS